MASGLENIETVESPFRRFVTTIGVFPTAFTDAMTYYECLAYLVKYMEDTMIPAINENAEAVEELQGLYIQLKTFVDTYFENLDVQEEINNKLDAMVEAGTLQEIITTYIQSNVAWTFDSVSDMQSSTNLVNGSFARTLGFHNINDGGGSYYKITNTGTANGIDTFAIGSLFAHLVVEREMLVTQFGFEGGDDISSLDLTNYAILKKLDLCGLTFNTTNSFNLKSNFELCNGKISSSAKYVVVLNNLEHVKIHNVDIDGNTTSEKGYLITSSSDITIDGCTIENLEIDDDIASGIYTNKCDLITIKNNTIKNIGHNSVTTNENVVRGIVLGNTFNSVIDNCTIANIYNSAKSRGDGVQYLAQGDNIGKLGNNIIKNTVIDSCAYRCVKIQQYGVTVENCKMVNTDNTISCNQSVIAVYDDYATIKNNKITHTSPIPICVGVVNENTTKVSETLIDGNYIQTSGTNYQGAITIPQCELVKDLVIVNNIIKSTTTSEAGVYCLSSYNNIKISNNIFDGVENCVFDRSVSGYAYTNTRKYLTVSGNSGNAIHDLVYINSTIPQFVSVTNNNIEYTSPLGSDDARNSVRVESANRNQLKNYMIANNKLTDQMLDGLRKYGSTTGRPVYPPDGYYYFDATIHKPINYYNGSWYLPDGTVSN